MKREEKPFSPVKGYSIKFENDGHVIHLWGSTLTGFEKVYVDETLVVSRRSFRIKSIIPFKIGEDNYLISIRVDNLLNGTLTCTLLREGIPIAKKRLIIPTTFLIEYILLVFVSIICIFGLINGHFSLLRLLTVAILSFLFTLFFTIRKMRGLQPRTEDVAWVGNSEDVSFSLGGGERAERTIPSADRGWKSLLMGFFTNLKAGFRAAIFLKVDSERFAVSEKQLLVLIVFNLAFVFLMDFIEVGPAGEPYLYYLPGALFYLPLMGIVAYGIAAMESKPQLKISIPVALISAGLWIELAGRLLAPAIDEIRFDGMTFFYNWDHYYRLFGWWLFSAGLLVYRLSRPLRKPLAVGLIFLLVLAVPFWFVPKWELWTQAYDDNDETEKNTIVTEDIFYLQPKLLEETLSNVDAGRRGVVDLYFLGFGADASEDVFRNEIDVVKRLFDERFDTRGRSIALINNDKTVATTPIATRTSLAKSIDRIAVAMNKEEDVLFLYLTSHGSKTHDLSVAYWPLRLTDINPQDIKKSLDHSGITWKVIVVSACYSGGFIDPLKDENTLIITSADANHTSMGCGAESDFTFLGKAYFDHALRKSFSFIEPFEEVKNEILKRELDMSETPSNPQIYIGAKILKQLEKLEFRLRRSFGSMQ